MQCLARSSRPLPSIEHIGQVGKTKKIGNFLQGSYRELRLVAFGTSYNSDTSRLDLTAAETHNKLDKMEGFQIHTVEDATLCPKN